MSLRTKIVATIAVAASAFLIAPAAAQAAAHPVQVSGAELKSALLPAAAFGSDFNVLVATSSGKSLLHKKAKKPVSAMSCQAIEQQGLATFGESAFATAASLNNNAFSATGLTDLNLLYDQTVYQFPSTKAAAAFFKQVMAKYASCKSFSENVSGNPDASGTITLKSIARTKVGTYKAFKLTQSLGDSGIPGVVLKLNMLFTVAGADVFAVVNFSTSNHPVAATTMLKLVDRVRALR